LNQQLNKNKIEIIGLMSGTSLDGLDVAHVSFNFENEQIDFELKNYKTVPYSTLILKKLDNYLALSVPEMLMLDKEIGRFYADTVNDFIEKFKIVKSDIDAIASHGQTIFHQPQNGFTYQIGCGTTLAFKTGIDVINDFRTLDVVAGGQGAPLVPIGDFNLFSAKANAFLNIGGFTNISFKKNNEIIAFDICSGNLPMNEAVKYIGLTYDKNGDLARKGKIDFTILEELQKLEHFHKSAPKSLGTEWLESDFYPIINKIESLENKLRTLVEHTAIEIINVLNSNSISSVYITGGGAKNSFLIERIRFFFKGEVIVPSEEIIDFKEAIIFAFLGARYLRNETTTVKSVTGASIEVSSGAFHRAMI
jgi:anhydro-N-acetylmuramic acid kinase